MYYTMYVYVHTYDSLLFSRYSQTLKAIVYFPKLFAFIIG